jgi:uncharacterized protein (TIGR02271 family)
LKTIVGLFDTTAHAQTAADRLESAGIAHNDISFLASNQDQRYGTVDNADASGDSMASAAVTDATWGASIGGILGALAGASLFVIPGLGWVVGGLFGALTHIGVPEEDAAYYTEGVKRGGTLLAVRAEDEQAARVANILDDAGAVDIEERGAQFRQEGFSPSTYYSNTGNTAPAATGSSFSARTTTLDDTAIPATMGTAASGMAAETRTLNANETATIPIVEEDIAVGKREVQRGGARVHTYVEQRPIQEQVNLREEHVTVDRRPVNRPVTSADWAAFRAGDIEVTETAEVPVVQKTARVVEEVTVGKEATQHTETVSDTVRRTGVDVEQIAGQTTGSQHVSRDSDYVGNNIPGVQTGGTAMDGTPDTRGITEKAADTLTGDRIDDKTGSVVR